MKIKATAEVRKLLVELDGLFQVFHDQTRILAEPGVSQQEAVNVGADRETQRSLILSCAYRINKASRGEV